MPVLMQEPAKYIADMALNKVVRHGGILKDVATGQIVGHLKETGQMGGLLSNAAPSLFSAASSLNPVSLGVDALGHGVNAYQIEGIKKTLEGLSLITNISAISSVAGLGVSVAGFAVVNNKLNKIESKLDTVVDDVAVIKNMLNDIHKSWEAMSNARLQKAAKTITVAEKSTSLDRRLELAKEAVSDFSLLRHYYSNLLTIDDLFEDIGLNVGHLHDLISRYTVTCLGELQAEFMIGDLGSYRERLETILDEFSNHISFSPQKVYKARCDKLPALTLNHDHKSLSESLVALSDYSNETTARLESHMVELEYLENNKLTVSEYLKDLREHETDIVLIPR